DLTAHRRRQLADYWTREFFADRVGLELALKAVELERDRNEAGKADKKAHDSYFYFQFWAAEWFLSVWYLLLSYGSVHHGQAFKVVGTHPLLHSRWEYVHQVQGLGGGIDLGASLRNLTRYIFSELGLSDSPLLVVSPADGELQTAGVYYDEAV